MYKISFETFQGIAAFLESDNAILVIIGIMASISVGIIATKKFKH